MKSARALIRAHHEFCLFIPGRRFETEEHSEEQFPSLCGSLVVFPRYSLLHPFQNLPKPAILKLPRGTWRRIPRILINQRFFIVYFSSLSFFSLDSKRPFFVSNNSSVSFLLRSEKNDLSISISISTAEISCEKIYNPSLHERMHFPFSRRGSRESSPTMILQD